MNESLILYSCHDDVQQHQNSLAALEEFAAEIGRECLEAFVLNVIDGNQIFSETRNFLKEVLMANKQGQTCSFRCILDHVYTVERIDSAKRRGRPQNLNVSEVKIAEMWARHSVSEIATSLKGKIIIVSSNSVTMISEDQQAHGRSEFKGRFCFIVRSYKNILLHEVAHLFGVDDHYCDNNRDTAMPECTDPRLCLMQWDPACKPCKLCDRSKKDINQYFSQRSSTCNNSKN